jgi:hypothetical protein
MEKPNISNAVLQKGIDIEIELAHPGLLTKLGLQKTVHKFNVKPLLTGPLMEICSLLEEVDFKEFESLNVTCDNSISNVINIMNKNVIHNIDKFNKVLAWGIYNRKINTIWNRIKFNKILKLIENNLDNTDRIKLLNVIIAQMGTRDFLAFMISIKGMNLNEVSKQTSGELSEESTHILDSQEMR